MNHIPAIIPSPLVLSTWVDNQWFLRFHQTDLHKNSSLLQDPSSVWQTSTPPRWNHLSKPESDIEGPEVVIEQTQSSKLKYTSWNTLWFTYDFAPRRPCWSMQQIVQKIEICGPNNSLLQMC
jgi:hypothetical protein